MSDQPKKLFLLDAFALIYRSYYAFIKNPRINSKGLNTSAIFGFTNTMIDLIKKENPTHIGVVFDPPGPTNRSVDFTDYKANREETPEDIRKSLPYIKQMVEAFNIPLLEVSGYEADDVVGTLAKKAEKEGFVTYMMTPDKDYAQLVSENIFMYKPGRGGKGPEVWGIKEVQEKFEVERPEQVIDILGLWGDAVDNIPGIPGIGEKTSKKLIGKYGSVEGLINHAHELKGKQQENVIAYAEQGLMSKMLATIVLDVPIEFEADALIIDPPNKEKVMELFSELEFRTMAKRVFGEDIQVQQATEGQMDLFGVGGGDAPVADNTLVSLKTIEDLKVDYQLVDSDDAIHDLVNELSKLDNFCFDTETTGLNPLTAELVGLAISWKTNVAYYIPFSNDFTDCQARIQLFKSVFENDKIAKTGQNLKYDINVLKKYEVDVNGYLFDTMIAHYLLQPDMKHGMDYLAETYLNYKTISIETLIGKKGKNQKSMRDLEPSEIVDYACEDADITWQLKELFEPQLNNDDFKKLYESMEMPLIKVLANMENEGIQLDSDMLRDYSKEIGGQIDTLNTDIQAMADAEFNLDSPRQLGEVLFDKMALDAKAKKTKTGQYATGEDILSKLKEKHEIIPKILEYRMLRKLKSTYVDTLPELVDPKTGRIHTTYYQTVAATGRLSSNNPNLQNIPIRTPQGQHVRKAFIPKDENFLLLSADYSQIELRIVAALSEDAGMIEAFTNGEDIHASTAAKVFGVAKDEVTRDMRSKAKAVNFGILYGQSAFGLSQTIGIKRGEAKEIIDSYFEQFSAIKSYISNIQDFAREKGYVETIMKRRRYLKDINSANAIVRGHAERNAINAPIQGSAADVIKLAMINIHEEMKRQNLKSKMLLQVHDELVFDAHVSELDLMKEMVKNQMESAFKMNVPLLVEMDIANNWLDAH
jgi:DNA polymerase-1